MRTMIVAGIFAMLLACGGPPGVGKSCEENEDCKSITGGYCVRAGICVADCTTVGSACDGTNGRCADVEGQYLCLQACDRDGDCGTGETCESGACVITNPLAEP